MLTQDCPIGLHAVRRKMVKKLSYAAALLLSCAASLLRGTGMAQAVTGAKHHAAKHAAKPPRRLTATGGVPVLPSPHLMGKIAPPHIMGKPVPPRPSSMKPQPTMGAPESARK